MRKLMTMVMVASAMSAPMAFAQEWKDMGEFKGFEGGPMNAAMRGTIVELNAQAHRVVTQDRVTVTLSVQKDGKTAEDVQKAINTQMQAAKKIYDKAGSDVKVNTAGYNVWQNYEAETTIVDGKVVKNEKQSTWRGNQQLVLDAASGDKVLKLVADLQAAGLAMQGMNYYLSQPETEKLTDELTDEALAKIAIRAQKLGKSIGQPNMAYVNISTGEAGSGYNPVPMMAKAMMARDMTESMPAPVGQAGQSDVSVNVTAKVRLTK